MKVFSSLPPTIMHFKNTLSALTAPSVQKIIDDMENINLDHEQLSTSKYAVASNVMQDGGQSC